MNLDVEIELYYQSFIGFHEKDDDHGSEWFDARRHDRVPHLPAEFR